MSLSIGCEEANSAPTDDREAISGKGKGSQ
jgi:hypothetical protein